MNLSGISDSIERGLDFLGRSQLDSGEFKVYRSTDELQNDLFVDSSPFPTALIGYSLSLVDSPKATQLLKQSLKFLLDEMEGPGLWRYWTKQHPHHSTIVPDLDDIACISYLLRRHNVPFPANEKLLLANRDRAGLFYTWLTPRWPLTGGFPFCRAVFRQWLNPIKLYYFWKLNESERNDVDCVVNANVLLYLGEHEATQSVIRYLIQTVRESREGCCDKWHLNRFTFYYVTARNYFAGVTALMEIRDQVIDRIQAAANEDGSIGSNILDTALAACALLSWRSSSNVLTRAIQFILSAQKAAGEWASAVLYYGGPKKFYGWGSEELTTGFCLEALSQYQSAHSLTTA